MSTRTSGSRFALWSRIALVAALPALGGARGDGCAVNSRSPAPDVTGTWNIQYDDSLDVEVTIGGQTYNSVLGPDGGVVTVVYQGRELTFDLDCSRPDVLCPSEIWPDQVYAEQRNTQLEHQMIVTIPTQSCAGQIVDADPDQCGPGTINPDCDAVCDGEMTVRNEERFGVIGERGDSFRLYLGAGVATNGINCALLAVSLADAELVTTGSAAGDDWQAVAMEAGLVTVGVAGGCLWAGDPDMDGELEALVLGASIKVTTGFTGSRQAF